jgi:hypothetical protein
MRVNLGLYRPRISLNSGIPDKYPLNPPSQVPRNKATSLHQPNPYPRPPKPKGSLPLTQTTILAPQT